MGCLARRLRWSSASRVHAVFANDICRRLAGVSGSPFVAFNVVTDVGSIQVSIADGGCFRVKGKSTSSNPRQPSDELKMAASTLTRDEVDVFWTIGFTSAPQIRRYLNF